VDKVTGTHLTIANYFPRNQASSDLLYALAKTYTQSGYSLKSLLVAIVASRTSIANPRRAHAARDRTRIRTCRSMGHHRSRSGEADEWSR